MHIEYKNNKLKKKCTDLKIAKKELPDKIADKLLKAINFIENSMSLEDVKNFHPFRFHDLKGKRDGQYAIDIGSRRDGYRLVMIFKESKETVFQNSIEITDVKIIEMGKHYE